MQGGGGPTYRREAARRDQAGPDRWTHTFVNLNDHMIRTASQGWREGGMNTSYGGPYDAGRDAGKGGRYEMGGQGEMDGMGGMGGKGERGVGGEGDGEIHDCAQEGDPLTRNAIEDLQQSYKRCQFQ